MEQPEFTALQVTIFIRTQPGEAAAMQQFLNSVPFEAQMQENLSHLVEQSLKSEGLRFEEVIIDLSVPAMKAKDTKKSSPIARLFGKG